MNELQPNDSLERILENLERVSAAASTVAASPPNVSGMLANDVRAITEKHDAQRNLQKIIANSRQASIALRSEPFISRIVATNNATAVTTTYYFCRGTPLAESPASDGQLASYKSPRGRMATHGPGEVVSISLPSRQEEWTVVERTTLSPQLIGSVWDGIDADYGATQIRRRIASIRQELERTRSAHADAELEALFDALDSETEQMRASTEASTQRQREARHSLSLRDQAILDRYQDDIFRLPVAKSIFLNGPPGTGKTTTLIKRLSQKLSDEFWDDDEASRLKSEGVRCDTWTMFSPTSLLKLYLKESFAKEHVPAHEMNIKTWTDERRRLSRDVLGIVKTQTSGTFSFPQAPDSALLLDSSSPATQALAERFRLWHEAEAVANFREALTYIAQNSADRPELAKQAESMAQNLSQSNSYGRLFDLIAQQSQMSRQERTLSEARAAHEQRIVKNLARSSPTLLADLAPIIDSMLPPSNEEDDDEVRSGTDRKTVVRALTNALRAHAREVVQGRTRGEARYAKIIEFLGPRVPSDDDARELYRLMTLRRHVVFLNESHAQLIDRIPASFQRFRRSEAAAGLYSDGAMPRIVRNEISAPEVDVVILAMLRAVRRLVSRPGGRPDGTPLAIVSGVVGEYKTHILVDEATDFSAVELACMAALSHPVFSSFFAAGDLRQRMTSSGIRSLNELQFAAPGLEVRSVMIDYRQSPVLAGFARRVSELLASSDESPMGVPHYEAELEAPPPLLKEQLGALEVASWVATRIREIERALGFVPAIALFVGREVDIDPITEALRAALEPDHIGVRACRDGRDVGHEQEIRVFSVEHIKGLEFEAVFVVAVDEMERQDPDLFVQRLYVGATRATRYLAITSQGVLPSALLPLAATYGATSW